MDPILTNKRPLSASSLSSLSSLSHCQNTRPYLIPVGRSRKNSSSSLSTCSDYSQPSPSYSNQSYESRSPEPYTAEITKASRLAEREARVFERLRQLVPVLPADRNAYQVKFFCFQFRNVSQQSSIKLYYYLGTN